MLTGRIIRALLCASVLPLVSGGCYTVFNHPARQNLGVDPADARAAEIGYYPYSPTVWGWYYGHYGDYWSYYAHPWWMSHYHHGGYYPDEDGFSPVPEASGFGRGGRDRATGDGREGGTSGWANPNTYVAPPPADPPPRPGSGTTTTAADDSSEKPTQEKKDDANVGGRGGRR